MEVLTLAPSRSLNENDLKCQPTDTLNLLRKDLPRIPDVRAPNTPFYLSDDSKRSRKTS